MTNCKHCGQPMRKYSGRGRPPDYCKRRECYLERNRIRVSSSYWRHQVYRILVCPECGEEFVTNKTNKIYCTELCKRRYTERKRYYRDRPELFAYAMRRRGEQV